MTRNLARALSVAIGYVIGLDATRYTHDIPGYGVSVNGDDPVALAVAVIVGTILWKISDRVTR